MAVLIAARAVPVAAVTGHPHRRELRLVLECAAIGLAVGLATVAPWTRHGYLMLLDWVSGPQTTLDTGVYGLSGSSLDAMPFRVVAQGLRHVIGPGMTAWVLLLAVFPLLAGGIGHMAGGGRWRRLPAALAAVCNPFVVERVAAGHVPFLLGVALLPWMAASAVGARRDARRFSARTAGWYGLAIAISPHAAWLGGVLLLVGTLVPRPTRRDLVRTATVMLAAGAVYVYAAVLLLTGTRTMDVTQADLDAYAPFVGPGGLLVTVLSLHGYWRGGDDLPRDLLGAWGVPVLVVVVAAVVVGYRSAWAGHRWTARPWAVLTAVGLVLATGVHGPVGALHRFALDHVPLFAAMREQEKWLALAVVGYALGLGFAVEAVAVWRVAGRSPGPAGRWRGAVVRVRCAAGRSRWVPVVAAAALGLVPLVCAPALVDGLHGRVQASDYPAAWYRADALMGDGHESILFLPWHAYQPLSMTQGRSVATAGPAFFRRPVLVSDAVELGGLRTGSVSRRTSYLDRLIAAGGTDGHVGADLVPLGARFVVLAHGPDDASYDWLRDQGDLDVVLDTPEITVLEVADVPADRLERTSPTSWHVLAGTPGVVTVPEEWSTSWILDGRPGTPTAAGTIAFDVDGAAHGVVFAPWRVQRFGVVASFVALLVLIVTGLREHRDDLGWLIRRRRPRHEPIDE